MTTTILTAQQQYDNLLAYLASLNQTPTEEQRLALDNNILNNSMIVTTELGVQVLGNTSEFILQSLSTWKDKQGIKVDGAKSRRNVLYGTNYSDCIRGGESADGLFGQGGNDILFGLGGADLIVGGEGNDRISGGDGDDEIIGDGGRDRVTLGKGNDVYITGQWSTYLNNTSQDIITDFDTSEDKLLLTGSDLGVRGSGTVNYDLISGWVSVDGVNQVNIGADQTGFSTSNWTIFG